MSSPLFPDDVLFLQRLPRAEGLYADALDGDWGRHTDAGMTEFEAKAADLAVALGTFDPVSERCINTLLFKAQAAACRCLRAILDAGVSARILSGTRSYADQHALYRRGRYGNPGPIVTKARRGQSNHNCGIAWDIGVFLGGQHVGNAPPYASAASTALAAGIERLEWGGNWTSFQDLPHFQLATGLSIAQVRQGFETGTAYVWGAAPIPDAPGGHTETKEGTTKYENIRGEEFSIESP